jgi:hypothetical protein
MDGSDRPTDDAPNLTTGRAHDDNVNDNVAAPARTTGWIPDALTALDGGTHGKLTLLLGDDR